MATPKGQIGEKITPTFETYEVGLKIGNFRPSFTSELEKKIRQLGYAVQVHYGSHEGAACVVNVSRPNSAGLPEASLIFYDMWLGQPSSTFIKYLRSPARCAKVAKDVSRVLVSELSEFLNVGEKETQQILDNAFKALKEKSKKVPVLQTA